MATVTVDYTIYTHPLTFEIASLTEALEWAEKTISLDGVERVTVCALDGAVTYTFNTEQESARRALTAPIC